MFKKSHFKGLTSVLGLISVLGCSSLNCALANGDEAKSKEKNILKWKELIEKAKKDAGWRWYLDYILSLFKFIEEGSLVKNEKILDTLENKLKEEDLYRKDPYCIEFGEIYEKNSTILWDSFNCLGLGVPIGAGQRIKFKGYDLVSARYIFGMHGSSDLVWITIGKNGNPVILHPSGTVDCDTDGLNEIRELDARKIEEVLPGMYNESVPAYRSIFDDIYKNFGEEVRAKVDVDVELSLDEIKKFSGLFFYLCVEDDKNVRLDFENYLKFRGDGAQEIKFKLYGLSISKKCGTHQFIFRDSEGGTCVLFFDLDQKHECTTYNERYSAIRRAPEFCEMIKKKIDDAAAKKSEASETKLEMKAAN